MAGEPWQQALLIIIFVLVIICVVRPLVFFRGKKYEFSINFAVSPLLGVLAGLATTVISPQMIKDGVEGNANVQPYSILILFFSLSYISIAIDVTGAFSFIALVATRYSQKSGKGLFITFFMLSALLTLASNNDIVILTLTPIIIYFCRAMNLDPVPYLVAQFYSANIWSACFYIGDPTNIIVAQAYNLNFVSYAQWTVLPTIFVGTVSGFLLYLTFRKQLPENLEIPEVDPYSTLVDPKGALMGCIILVLCMIALVANSFTSIDVWIFTLPFAGVMLAWNLFSDLYRFADGKQAGVRVHTRYQTEMQESPQPVVHQPSDHSAIQLHPAASSGDGGMPAASASDSLAPAGTGTASDSADPPRLPPFKFRVLNTTFYTSKSPDCFAHYLPQTSEVFSRQPYSIVPFVLSMFVLVEALSANGLLKRVAEILGDACSSEGPAIFLIAFLAVAISNIINNQPMTILLVRVLQSPEFVSRTTARVQRAALFQVALSSNFGNNLTLIGALAGIMWSAILKHKGITVSYTQFFGYGIRVVPACVAVSSLIFYQQTFWE